MATPKTFLRNHSPEDWEALPNNVAGWFDDVLRESDPHPSRDECTRLAEKFRIIANRCNNDALMKQGALPLHELKDTTLAEFENSHLASFLEAASRLLAEAGKLEAAFGNYTWERDGVPICLLEIQEILLSIGAGRPQEELTLGRRESQWHAAGREIAREIQAAMLRVGYCGSLSAKKSESVTAQVGSRVVNWFFKNSFEITPAGFAAAIKSRNRSKAKAPAFLLP